VKENKDLKVLADELAGQGYPITMTKEEDGYYITFPDLKGCSTFIASLDELEENAYEAKLSWIQAALMKGWHVPKPIEDSDFSGRFLVRCPRTVHKRLVENAKREGVSLNHYVVSTLAGNSLGDRAVQILEERITEVVRKSFIHSVDLPKEWDLPLRHSFKFEEVAGYAQVA